MTSRRSIYERTGYLRLLVAAGLPTDRLAEALEISQATVTRHLKLMAETDVDLADLLRARDYRRHANRSRQAFVLQQVQLHQDRVHLLRGDHDLIDPRDLAVMQDARLPSILHDLFDLHYLQPNGPYGHVVRHLADQLQERGVPLRIIALGLRRRVEENAEAPVEENAHPIMPFDTYRLEGGEGEGNEEGLRVIT